MIPKRNVKNEHLPKNQKSYEKKRENGLRAAEQTSGHTQHKVDIFKHMRHSCVDCCRLGFYFNSFNLYFRRHSKVDEFRDG